MRLRTGAVSTIVAGAVGVLFAAAPAFVLWRAVRLGGLDGSLLDELRAPLWRTLQLAVLVSATCVVVGTGLAWLVTRTDLPLRRLLRTLLVLPLVIPSFVGAAALASGLAPGGVLRAALGLVGVEAPRRVRGLLPAWLVLSSISYPYVLLPVAARLQTMRAELDETARLLGCSSTSTFLRVTLPQLRSAMLAGGLLVFLYSVSEFGAVQLLGYDTLTRVIYATRQLDRATSFGAASLVLALALAVVVAARRTVRGDIGELRRQVRALRPVPLRRLRIPAFLASMSVLAIGLLAPVMGLGGWAWRGIVDDRIDVASLARPAWNTAATALVTAVVAVLVVLPVAWGAVRRPNLITSGASVSVIGGFALPGIVVALALAVLTLNTPALASLYQTMPLLLGAYVIHFGSQALAGTEQAVRAVSAEVRSSALLLEPSAWRRLARVDAPLMRPGLLAGGGLVMLATLKDLPSTLLLAPIGFRTLATEIWGSFEEGFYADAAVAAIILVAMSAVLTWFLVVRARPSRA